MTTEKICGQKLQTIQHWSSLNVKSTSSGIIRLGWNSQITTQVLWPWSIYLTPLGLSFLKREYHYNPPHRFCEIKGGSLYPAYNRHAVNIDSCCSTVAVAATSNTTTTVAPVAMTSRVTPTLPCPAWRSHAPQIYLVRCSAPRGFMSYKKVRLTNYRT